jgi:hypothetical protein
MMRAVIVLGITIAGLVSLPVAPARAVLLEVLPPSQSVVAGATLELRLAVSGLGDQSAPSLGTFDVDVGFDPTVLGFVGASFGDPVLGDQLDLFGLGSISDVTPGVGTVNLVEVSLDTSNDLDTLQAGAFVLATLTFEAVGQGSSTLALNLNALGDAGGLPLAADLGGGTVRVTPGGAPIPEPSTAVLLIVGMIALGVHRIGLARARVGAHSQRFTRPPWTPAFTEANADLERRRLGTRASTTLSRGESWKAQHSESFSDHVLVQQRIGRRTMTGVWDINANGFVGELNITSIDDAGNIQGTILQRPDRGVSGASHHADHVPADW